MQRVAKKKPPLFSFSYICCEFNLISSDNDNRPVERLEGSCERLEEVSLTTIVKL